MFVYFATKGVGKLILVENILLHHIAGIFWDTMRHHVPESGFPVSWSLGFRPL